MTGALGFTPYDAANPAGILQSSFNGSTFGKWPAGIYLESRQRTNLWVQSNVSQTISVGYTSEPVTLRDARSFFTALSGSVAATIADGADVAEGAKADLAATTSVGNFTVVALLKGALFNLLALVTALARIPASLGQKVMALSFPVVIASDQSEVAEKVADGSDVTQGAKADAAATAGTLPAPYSTVALLKGILTNTAATAAGAVTIADGADVAEGAKADLAATTSVGSFSVIALLKGALAQSLLLVAALARFPASLGQKVMALSFPVVIASDQSSLVVDDSINTGGTVVGTYFAGSPISTTLFPNINMAIFDLCTMRSATGTCRVIAQTASGTLLFDSDPIGPGVTWQLPKSYLVKSGDLVNVQLTSSVALDTEFQFIYR